MSILSALKQQHNSIDDLAALPQAMIMQMAQKKQISEEMLAPILARKAEMADAFARQNALQNAGQVPPTVVEQLVAKNAQAENPMPQQTAQQMPQAPEETGVGQLPIPTRTYAGGGIIAFADGGLSDDEDDDKLEMSMARHAASKMDNIISGIKNVPAKLSEFFDTIPKSFETKRTEIANMVMPKSGNHKYEEAVIAEAKKQGVDPQLALHVLYKETGGHKNPDTARSHAGAIGPMQLMPKTAKSLGVDPTDPMQNIHGGIKYLAQLGPMFGNDPRLTAAAYNAGPGNVRKYGGVPNFKETQNYVRGLADGGYIPSYAGTDGISYVDLYGNKVNVPMDADEETTPKTTKTEPKYKETPRKSIDEILKPVKPAGPQNPFMQRTAGISSLAPRSGGDEYSNVYPAGGAGADASYLNQLIMESQKDPSYKPYQDEIAALLKKNPSLGGIVANQNKVVAQPPANQPVKNVTNKPSMDKNAAVDQYLNEYLSNTKPQGQPATTAQKAAEESIFEKMMARNEEERKRINESAKEDKNLALLAAGLGMMGGTSPYAFANIGQGGLQGIQALAASKTRRAAELTALNKGEATQAYYGEMAKDRQERGAMNKANQLRDDFRTRENDIRNMITKMAASNPRISSLPPDQQQALIDKQIRDALSGDEYYKSLAKQLGFSPTSTPSASPLNYNPKTRSVG